MAERLRRRIGGSAGFAGIEFVIVLGVLGVMLAVAVPSFLGFRGGSADGATKESLRKAMPAAEAYFTGRKSYAGMDSTDLIRIDPRVSVTVSVTTAKRRTYCLTNSVDGKTWSVRGPNPTVVTDPSSSKGWFEGDSCR